MIFIITKEGDTHVDLVTAWLRYYKYSFYVYNSNKVVVVDYIINDGCFDDFVLTVDNQKIKYSDITAFWYVRGDLMFLDKFDHDDGDGLASSYYDFLNVETLSLRDYIYYLLCKKRHINNPQFRRPNKMITLSYASSCGLKTPFCVLTSSKEIISEYKQSLVVKPIQEIMCGSNDHSYWQSYTTMVNDGILDNFDDTFFPSLLQTKLDIDYELRVFYLDGVFVPMAIITNSSSGIVDSRFYSKVSSTRYVPCQLPKRIEKMLAMLMRKCSLKSGCIDLIKTKQNEYVFLEVNPSGYFSAISLHCNIKVEKLIAEFLISKS